MRATKQHGLASQRDAFLPVAQDLLHDVPGLPLVVQHAHERGPPAAATGCRKRLAMLPSASGEQGIGRIQDRLDGAVVLLERDDLGRTGELAREVEDVLDPCSPERVDRLGVVPHDHHAGPVWLQARQDLRLQRVGVLVLVDQDLVEGPADLRCDGRLVHQHAPVEKEVVVVEDPVRLLARDVGAEQRAQLLLPVRAPGEALGEYFAELAALVHAVRVDR